MHSFTFLASSAFAFAAILFVFHQSQDLLPRSSHSLCWPPFWINFHCPWTNQSRDFCCVPGSSLLAPPYWKARRPWGRGWRGSGSSRYMMSENFWHPIAHVDKLQISLLMLITDFYPSRLHCFTSWALSREWLLWDVLKMHHFTQLGFSDNLELKKKTATETGWTHCWFAELRQLIGRLSSELCEFFFQYVWRTNTGKAISRRSI